MTNFYVKAVYSGTSKTIAVSAQNARIAMNRAMNSKQCKGASCFIVYYRKLGNIPILTSTCSRFDLR